MAKRERSASSSSSDSSLSSDAKMRRLEKFIKQSVSQIATTPIGDVGLKWDYMPLIRDYTLILCFCGDSHIESFVILRRISSRFMNKMLQRWLKLHLTNFLLFPPISTRNAGEEEQEREQGKEGKEGQKEKEQEGQER
jgi:hypothetical protein